MKLIEHIPLAMSFLYGRLEDLEIDLEAKLINFRQVATLGMDIHNRSMRLFNLIKADPDYSSHPSTSMLIAALEKLDRQLQIKIYEHVPSILCGNIREAKRHLKLLQSMSIERAIADGIEVIND